MALTPTAIRGAVAFLTRLPVGGGERAWDAFRQAPAAAPVVGYLVGALAGLPFLLSLPPASAAVLYLFALYLLVGVTHADGLADLGDAAATHRSGGGGTANHEPDRDRGHAGGATEADPRIAAMRDSSVGVGGALALGLALVGLALGGVALARAGPVGALRIVVAAEVGAKAGVALLCCLGTARHRGLGSEVVGAATPRALAPVALVTAPAVAADPGGALAALVAAVLAGPAAAWLVGRWARARLGGISGDVLGAAHELGRVAGVHAGVVAWTLW